MTKKTPDWFDRLLDRSAGRDLDSYRLLDSLYQEPQALKQDTFDRRKYDEILHQANDLLNVVHGRAPDYPTWEHLIQDAYLSLWKARPDLRDQTEMRPSHVINWMTMDKVMGAGVYEELRTWTRLDDWAAAMGTVSLALKLAEYFDEQQDLIDKLKDVLKQEQQILTVMQQAEQDAEDMTDEEIDEFLDSLEESLNALAESGETLEDAAGAQQYGLRQAIHEGMDSALDSAEDVVGLVQNFGTNPGQWERLDPRVRMELAHRLQKNRKLHDIAKMVGRIKRMAIGEWSRRVVHGVDEVYDVTIGSDLEHVLASELTYLADPESEDIFWVKYLEGTLLNYKLRGTEKANRGAIVCLLDNSGSMYGEQEIWGKGVAMALLEIAKRERRDFYGIHFGSSHELVEWFFPKGEVNLADALDYAEFFFNGGTDFETPISRAVEVLDSQFRSDGATRGDIVMITDGECAVSSEWLTRFYNAKDQMDFKLFGCLIGWHSRVLDELSDKMFTIKDITSGGDVKEAFTLI
jgi:uncharacterized protein with von Willebrand factor type A (vWA) domain